MDSLGKRIRDKRQEKRLSQDELAHLMEKSGKQIISNWETNRTEPSLNDLRKLANVLSTSASWLIDGVLEVAVSSEPPPGYILMSAEEVIEMQRQLLKRKDQQLAEQK